MTTRRLLRMKRTKKGISPVVATVILVAVAVVIAAALAGFAGSLFGSYSNGPQVKIVTMAIHAGVNPTVDLTMSNSGNAADAITKISLNNVGDANSGAVQAGTVSQPAGFTGTPGTLPANTNPVEIDGIVVTTTGTTPAEGQQVTAVVSMQSGSTITQTVTVTA